MPEHHKERHYDGHSHQHGHPRDPSAKFTKALTEYVWQWFWGCCQCGGHSSMSTFIEQCPGCAHTRCAYCPMESVKIRASQLVVPRTSPTAASSTMEAVHRNDLSMENLSAQIDQCDLLHDPLTDLTTLSLALTEQSDSPFHSNHSSGIFSLGTAALDSTTDFDSQNTESDSSGSSEEPTNEVVKNLDCRLLSVLNGNLDLAARLMPKIHNLLNEEDRLPSIGNSVFQHENRLSNVKSKGSNGKQMVSGDSSSAPTSKNGPSEGSPQKHGRGSEECDGQEEGNSSNCKRHRQGSEGGSEDTHGGDSEGDPVENPGADTVGTPGDDTFSHPYGAPDKNPEDPGGDPGDDPSLAESLDNVPNFACHFYKLDPIKYGPWTDNKYEKCPGSRITALRRIKYHFKAVHTQSSPPPPYCKRCFSSFQNTDSLDEHYQATVPCNPTRRPSSLNDGIDEDQWKKIERVFWKRGKKHVDDISRWNEIWQILFPGVEKPPHPWNEPPGYVARPSYDVEDILVNFERRIKRDRTLEGVEERTQERYLHLLRQTLEEDRATFSTFQTRRSGRSREEEPSFTSFGKVQASNSDHMFSTGGEVPPPPSQTSRLGNWSFPAKPSGEDFREESHVMRPWCSSRIPASSMSVPIKGFVEPALKYSEPLVPESNFAYQDWPPAELNFDPNEDPQVLFDDYKLVVNGEGSSEVSVAPQPEADRNTTRERDLAQDQFDGNYIMGEDLMEISDLLQLENELQDAAGP